MTPGGLFRLPRSLGSCLNPRGTRRPCPVHGMNSRDRQIAAPIKAVIVDDEPLAREAIRLRLEDEPDIDVIGEAADGFEAVELVRAVHPDLLFLDVQMPAMDGFEVIEKVSSVHLPIVVFVTAHDRYALKAFETHALDYLLKPFTAGRFHAALDRARLEVAKAGDHETHQRLIELLEERRRARDGRSRPATGAEPDYLVRLAVKRGDRIVLVNVADIDWFESAANYVRLYTRHGIDMVRTTMSDLERRLDPTRFARIHRSTIVQVDRIEDIIAAWHGDFDVTLRNGTVLRLSRNYRERVLNRPDRP
jgi:two-component system LytT family response regulator